MRAPVVRSGRFAEEGDRPWARVSGGFFSSLFDLPGKKFVTAECDDCGYTEFYRRASSTAGRILDFFTG